MKQLNYYKERELNSEDEVFNFLINNLQESISTWSFFVDWGKIRNNVADVEEELNLLNTLIGKDNSEEKFIELVEKYPRIRKALSLLIAVRARKMRKTYIVNDEDIGSPLKEWEVELKRKYFKVNKDLDKKTKEELLSFYKNSGLKEIFENKDIKNIQDYYFGVEVGLDTNARKNRKGKQMEDIVHNYLEKSFSKVMEQPSKRKLKNQWNIKLEMKEIETNKKFDFAVLSEENKLYLIEVNYYSRGGSKLKSTAGEYKDYENFLEDEEAEFIWITDGKGWETAIKALKETFKRNKYVFNLKMISEGILDEVIK